MAQDTHQKNPCFLNKEGGILVAFIPLSLIFFFLTIFIIDHIRILYWSDRIQIITDQALLSSLRMRAEGLARITTRWKKVNERLARGHEWGAEIVSSDWFWLQDEARKLKRSLSGYKGRIFSINKVIAESNGIQRDSLKITDDRGLMLGIEGQDLRTQDENAVVRHLENGYYLRIWDLENRLGQPSIKSAYTAQVTLDLLGSQQKANIIAHAHGNLIWNVNFEDPEIQAFGLGGYGRRWSEIVIDGIIWNHRFPYFSAELKNEK